MSLKPCPFRQVGEEGHILCDKIKTGDREVSPNICRACPISQINCVHLRAVLDNQTHPPLTVRYGNGKTEVWQDPAPAISFKQAACAAKVSPINSPRDCAGCALRQALVSPNAIQTPAIAPLMPENRPPTTDRRRRMPAPIAPSTQVAQQPVAPQPIAQPAPQAAATPPAPVADARSSVVAAKIIQLQEWLAKQKTAPQKPESEESVQPIAMPVRPTRVANEEKRVGWTD